MTVVLVLAGAYLVGSFLPAYFIGKARGVDLREVGTHNPGTTNAWRELGPGAGIVSGVYDVGKSLLAMFVAWRLGLPETVVYAAGVAAVLGHRFPFYLGFHGGQGVAASTGMLLYALVYAIAKGWLSWGDLAFMAFVAGGMFAIFRRGATSGVAVLPLLVAFVVYRSRQLTYDVFLILVAGYIWTIELQLVRREHLLRLTPEARASLGQLRVFLRPFALAFPVLYLFLPKAGMLALIGAVALFFITVDVARLLSKRLNSRILRRLAFFYRPNEEHTFTSATLFLVAAWLTVLLFPRPVATLAIVFVTFGDLFAKYAGIEHGRVRVFTTRTLEGSLAYFVACVVAGFVWTRFLPLPMPVVVLGALAASLTELAPLGLNDNFTVPLISAAVMSLPMFFRAA